MKRIRPRTWKGFINAIDRIRSEYGMFRYELESGETYERKNVILFRGQPDSRMHLETTLERKTNKVFHVADYIHTAINAASEIESYTGVNWDIPIFPKLNKEINEKQDSFYVHLPCYDYLVYLRQHGFPSPLLDWSESPFIAAYFAYIYSNKVNPAVYCYIETPKSGKGGTGGEPKITVKGPFVRTHKRHFAQKAWYTLSTRWDYAQKLHFFCSHENVFNRDTPDQDVLIKIVLPIKERQDALLHLNDYNINHFTLFQTEDALIKSIETKKFDIE